MNNERLPLLFKDSANSDLSLLFATLCVIDIFGVFPIIALPRSIVQCGLYGIPLVLVVFALQIYTAVLLGKSWTIATTLDPQISRKNRHPLAAVTELTLGPRARTLVTIILDLAVFGCSIPNLLVASQNLQLFGLKVSSQRFDLSFCYWLLIVGLLLCPIMWLGSPRDMKILASFSSTMVILTAVLIWWCIITDDRELNTTPIPASPTWDKLISGYGMLAFQFDVHPTLMTVQVDMRRPQDINKAVIISFLVSGSLFVVTTSLAIWKYGGSTAANVLQMVPGNIMMSAAILFAAVQLCLSSALGHSALFQDLEDQCNIQRTFGWKRCAIRSAVVFLGVAVGESVPRFDIVMALIGGSLTGVPNAEYHRYSYFYYDDLEEEFEEIVDYDDTLSSAKTSEGLLMTRRSHDHEPIFIDANRPFKVCRRTTVSEESVPKVKMNCNFRRWNQWFSYLVVLFGIVVTISSTYINVKNTIRYVQFTPPCIVNVTVVQNSV
ncbi:solute carrier family member mahogany isoform X3 [Osmia lignaria lignaria]|uniref:solute carrier family member mahogany isoform X3 n=1 Tax=Osmia lignaria lignaria TaxID=1437193 RepID=UPI0014780A61|nr:amino acid transporter AVT1D isoform X3 [Osmia lignaria]